MSELVGIETPQAAVEPPKETPKEAATQPVAEAKPSSTQLLERARKEAEIVKKEAARKAEIARLQEELKTTQNNAKFLEDVKTLYKSDPLGVLEKLGISYDDLTEAVISVGGKGKAPKAKKEPVDVQAEVERILAQREAEALRLRMEQAAEGFIGDIQNYVKENASKFPHLSQLHNQLGGVETPEELIYNTIDAYFNETGEILEFDAAATAIEEQFREEWTALSGKLKPTTEEKVAESKDPVAEGEEVIKSNVTGHGQGSLSLNDFKQKDFQPFTLTNKIPQRKPFDAKTEIRKSGEQRALEMWEKMEAEKKSQIKASEKKSV